MTNAETDSAVSETTSDATVFSFRSPGSDDDVLVVARPGLPLVCRTRRGRPRPSPTRWSGRSRDHGLRDAGERLGVVDRRVAGAGHRAGVDLGEPLGGARPAEPGRRARPRRGTGRPGARGRARPRRSRWPSRRCRARRRGCRPSPTAVGRPPTLAATTGVPQACASTATSPKDSLCEGIASTSAARYHWARVGPVDRRHEAHQVTDAALLGELGEAHRVAHAGAARPAEDGDDDPGAQVGAAAHQLGSGLDEHVGRLEGLDAADEQEEHGIRGDADLGPCLALRPGVEDGEVDARLGDDDPGGVGVVEVDELAGLAARCWRRAGRRPRRPGPRRSRGPPARGGHRRRGGGS